MKRKRKKEWKKRSGKKTSKSIMIQDHEVSYNFMCTTESYSKVTGVHFGRP